MILLTGFYHDADAGRRSEFQECLRRNLANDWLDEIHVVAEEPWDDGALLTACPLLADPKVRLIPLGRRATFHDLFDYANRCLSGRRIMIANADIYTDESLSQLAGRDLTGQLLCLSRWDVQGDGSAHLFAHPSSQDAWIFDAPIGQFACDFYLGVPGCDNRLAWEAALAGLVLSNPSRSLRVYHLHLTPVHRYSEQQRLTGPSMPVPVAELATPESGGADGPVEPRRPLPEVAQPRLASREFIYALTSLSATPTNVSLVRQCIASWRNAGLQVVAFNHPDEIPDLTGLYDVEFVPVAGTTASIFGKHFVPIKCMLDWAAAREAPVLFINSDIRLRLAAWELQRLRWISEGGLCYLIRHNHDDDESCADLEISGIDGFLFHGRDAGQFPDSFLSMGQPFWDYWLPYVFSVTGRPVCAVEFPAAFHRRHEYHWSWQSWHHCGLEFARVTGESPGDGSFDGCMAMSRRVRESFDRRKRLLDPRPFPIREWVEKTFRLPGAKTILELGSHRGEDTAWLADLPDVSLHAFEPDPRNQQPPRPNVTLHRAAIGDADGTGPLSLSQQGWGQEWTLSSSIKQPKNHLHRYPVTFSGSVDVEVLKLDTFCERHALQTIDFIWADIQGAEGEMIRGGRRTLERTRYLYTEYSDDELYDQQATLKEILDELPDFRVVELWPDDVLLENTNPKL
jgi:FkbM family methyltransferase